MGLKVIYAFRDYYDGRIEINSGAIDTRAGRHGTGSQGIGIRTTEDGVIISDDQIPGLVAALQNYMSRRARELAKGATR